jgi:hypothetical protein
MSTPKIEKFLALLYCEEDFLKQFLQSPQDLLQKEDFTLQQQKGLLAINRSELILAARSYNSKRESRKKHL